MKLKLLLTLAVFSLVLSESTAQLKTGFKTGLNFARMRGPIEKDAAGTALETYGNVTGFHIGMTLSKPINDFLGVRAEVLFSKKGGKYTFESASAGGSYRYFPTSTGSVLTSSNNVRYLINITNSYIDIPLMVYGRWRDWELTAGAGIGLLVSSVGDGSMTYSGVSAPPFSQVQTGELKFNLDHNYRKDDPGSFTEGTEVVTARLNNQTVELPKTIGAYYDYSDDKGDLFNAIDFNAVVGLQYYLSRSLYAGVRLQYGLADITNNKVDISRTKLDSDNKPVLQTDKDTNFAIQASVGFSF